MTNEELHQKLVHQFGDLVGPIVPAKDPFCVVKAESIVEICRFMKASGFDFLEDLGASDHPKEQLMRVVYHLYSYSLRVMFVLKVELPRRDPHVASVERVWKALGEDPDAPCLGGGYGPTHGLRPLPDL